MPGEFELEDVGYWPNQVPMQETIESFCSLFQFVGFEPCDSALLEPGFEKIALRRLGEASQPITRRTNVMPPAWLRLGRPGKQICGEGGGS